MVRHTHTHTHTHTQSRVGVNDNYHCISIAIKVKADTPQQPPWKEVGKLIFAEKDGNGNDK